MSKYLMLIRASRGGSLSLVSAGAQAEESHRKAVSELGGEVEQYYQVTGQYDLVMIVNLPEDSMCLAISQAWNVAGLYVDALRIYGIDEVQQAASRLGELLSSLPQPPDSEQEDAGTAR